MKRNNNLNLIRSLAIFSVVACHVTERMYPLTDKSAMLELSSFSQLLGNAAFTFGRIGVPLFFYLTGYLLLSRDYSGDNLLQFYKQKLLPLYFLTVCGIIFLTAVNVWKGAPFSLGLLLKQCLLLTDLPGIQTWYMPVILRMYLLLPFVARMLQHTEVSELKAPVFVVFVYTFAPQTINRLLLILGKNELVSTWVDFGFITGYGLYIILGWMLSKGVFKSVKKYHLWLGMSLSLVLLVAIQYYGSTAYSVWYNDGLIVVISICLFELLCRLTVRQRIFSIIAGCSFGIYWIHSAVIDVLFQYITHRGIDVSREFGVVVGAITIFCISWLFVWLFKLVAPRISIRKA